MSLLFGFKPFDAGGGPLPVPGSDKRRSQLNVARPWIWSPPQPDGDITGQADRQHVTYVYRDILAGGVVTVPDDVACLIQVTIPRRIHFTESVAYGHI